MNISCNEYYKIGDVKNIWMQILNQNLCEHTPYQSYEYNKLCYKFFLFRKKNRWFKPLILLFEDLEHGFLSIWALLLNTKDKVIYSVSHNGPMDYWDIISNTDERFFHSNCLCILKQRYATYRINLENIIDGYDIIKGGYTTGDLSLKKSGRLISILSINELSLENCVSISVKNYKDYIDGLSKHQRQNIRTAYNRIQKDNLIIQLKRYDANTKGISLIDYFKCMLMYEKRSVMKLYRNGGSISFWARMNRYKNMIFSASNISFLVIPSRVIYVLYVNGAPGAYMAGFIGNGRFYINRLSCSNYYLKYDMGILIIDQLMRIAKDTIIWI